MAKVVREEDIFSESNETGRRTGTSESAILRQQTGLNSLNTALNAVAALLAPGIITPFAGSAAPTGWLLCYGQSISTTTYAALFAAIGTTYGGSGGNFNVPDLRGRTAIAADNMGGTDAGRLTITANTLGTAGGVETHPLAAGELAAHTHAVSGSTGGGTTGIEGPDHAHLWPNGGSGTQTTTGFSNAGPGGTGRNVWDGAQAHSHGIASNVQWTTGVGSNHTHSVPALGINFTSGSAGSGTGHQNMQPFIVLNYLIKI